MNDKSANPGGAPSPQVPIRWWTPQLSEPRNMPVGLSEFNPTDVLVIPPGTIFEPGLTIYMNPAHHIVVEHGPPAETQTLPNRSLAHEQRIPPSVSSHPHLVLVDHSVESQSMNVIPALPPPAKLPRGSSRRRGMGRGSEVAQSFRGGGATASTSFRFPNPKIDDGVNVTIQMKPPFSTAVQEKRKRNSKKAAAAIPSVVPTLVQPSVLETAVPKLTTATVPNILKHSSPLKPLTTAIPSYSMNFTAPKPITAPLQSILANSSVPKPITPSAQRITENLGGSPKSIAVSAKDNLENSVPSKPNDTTAPSLNILQMSAASNPVIPASVPTLSIPPASGEGSSVGIVVAGRVTMSNGKITTKEDLLVFLVKVKQAFAYKQNPAECYYDFLKHWRAYSTQSTYDKPAGLAEIGKMFEDYPALIVDFNKFLPRRHKLKFTPEVKMMIRELAGLLPRMSSSVFDFDYSDWDSINAELDEPQRNQDHKPGAKQETSGVLTVNNSGSSFN